MTNESQTARYAGSGAGLIGLGMNAAGAKGGSAAYQQANPSLAPNGSGTTAAH
jgi:hypothetical protein